MRPIPREHPLAKLFAELVDRNFTAKVGMHDREVISYIAGLLVDFTHTDNLYRIRDARGRRLEDVGEMLLESHPLLRASSFDREREVRKHIGDYTLFMTGMFPESLRRRSPLRLEYFVDYIKAGKESYRIVSEFNLFEYAESAPLFRKLSESFDYCVVGLNFVRSDIELLQSAYYGKIKEIIG